MGVAGCGKSALGAAVAQATGLTLKATITTARPIGPR